MDDCKEGMETTFQRNITNRRGDVEMKKIVCCLMAIILVSFLLTDCSKNRGSNSGTRTIVDMDGRTVKIPETVNKVFCGWFQGALHMMTLGAADKLVAVSQYFTGEGFPWAYEICSDLANITRDQAPFNNLEALLAYNPDVVFTLADEDIMPEDYENVGITAVVVRFTDYDTFMRSIAIMGEVLGGEHAAKAARFSEFFTGNIEMVNERLADISETDEKLVHYVNSKVDNALFTKGRDQIEATWIKMAGGRFATEEYTGTVELTEEKLLQLNPDIILCGDQNSASGKKWLLNNTTLKNLDAVKNNQVYRTPQGIFPWDKMAAEASMQMVWAAKLLHPNKFEDIDIAKMAQDFYLEFYGANVSDENIALILEGRQGPTGE
jgi:iron complex transport system substrate-binding protein